MSFMCKWCGEATTYDRMSKRPGVCRDCYIIGDIDRFREYDTPQECPEDTSHTQEESSPEPLPEKLPEHTMISDPLPLNQRVLRGIPVEQCFATREEQDKNIPEPSPPQSQSEADTADK